MSLNADRNLGINVSFFSASPLVGACIPRSLIGEREQWQIASVGIPAPDITGAILGRCSPEGRSPDPLRKARGSRTIPRPFWLVTISNMNYIRTLQGMIGRKS